MAKKRITKSTKEQQFTFHSVAAFADAAEQNGPTWYSEQQPGWCGATWEETMILARMGWTDELDSALELAESAVTLADKEHMMDSFNQPVWDVTGVQVDVGAYLAGTPECMIDYPLSTTSKAGRVITLCASVIYSAGLEPESVKKRGRLITALALALSRLGHNVELWADLSGSNEAGTVRHRVLVKGADDELDPARVMFAYAHPAMLRQLHFSAMEGHGYRASQSVLPPKRDLPEGTIYLPELRSGGDVPNADEFLRAHLGELGLLAE